MHQIKILNCIVTVFKEKKNIIPFSEFNEHELQFKKNDKRRVDNALCVNLKYFLEMALYVLWTVLRQFQT